MNKTASQVECNGKSITVDGYNIPCKCGGVIRQTGKAKLEDYHGEMVYMEEWGCDGCGHSFWYWS